MAPLIFPCTIKSRSSLLAPAHPGGPGKKGRKMVVVTWMMAFRFKSVRETSSSSVSRDNLGKHTGNVRQILLTSQHHCQVWLSRMMSRQVTDKAYSHSCGVTGRVWPIKNISPSNHPVCHTWDAEINKWIKSALCSGACMGGSWGQSTKLWLLASTKSWLAQQRGYFELSVEQNAGSSIDREFVTSAKKIREF